MVVTILSAGEQHTVLHYAYIEKQTMKIMNKRNIMGYKDVVGVLIRAVQRERERENKRGEKF